MPPPIAASIFRPNRHALDDTWFVTTELEAAAAWEALAREQLIPSTAIDDPLRSFRTGGRSSRSSSPRRLLSETPGAAPSRVQPYPVSSQHAAVLASDVDGLQAAERWAREAAEQLAPWDSGYAQAPPTHVVWRVVPWSEVDGVRRPYRQPSVLLALELTHLVSRTLFERGVERPAADSLPPEYVLPDHRPWFVHMQIFGALCFARASEAGLVVPAERPAHPRYRDFPVSLAGRPFASLDNPFWPMLEVVRLGYAIAAITPDAIAMFAPSLHPSGSVHRRPLPR